MYKYLRLLVEKARQKGFTLTLGLDSAFQGVFQPFRTIVLSKGETEAIEFLQKTEAAYNTIDEVYKEQVFKLKFYSDYIWCPTTKSEVISLPCTGGRSFTCDRLIIDEASFVKKRYNGKIDLKTLMATSVPTVEKTGGQVVVMSTCDGMDEFESRVSKAVVGDSAYKFYFFGCFDDPTFTQADRDQYEKDNGEDLTNQEYPRTWEEGFLSSGSPRFDRQVVRWYLERAIKVELRGLIETTGKVVIDPKGPLRFFRKRKPRGQYLIAADVAEGLEHRDYSVAIVIDRETTEIVAEWHGHIEHSEFGTILALMGKHWNNAVLAVETGVSAHGTSAVTQLRNVEKYPISLIHQSNHAMEKSDDVFKNPERRFGWMTTPLTKPIIINHLATCLNNRAIPGVSLEQGMELRSYIREKNGKTNAESGKHDDRVMALAIAYYLLQLYPPKPTPAHQNCGSCVYRGIERGTGRILCKYSARQVIQDEEWCSGYRLLKDPIQIHFERNAKRVCRDLKM